MYLDTFYLLLGIFFVLVIPFILFILTIVAFISYIILLFLEPYVPNFLKPLISFIEKKLEKFLYSVCKFIFWVFKMKLFLILLNIIVLSNFLFPIIFLFSEAFHHNDVAIFYYATFCTIITLYLNDLFISSYWIFRGTNDIYTKH